MPLQFPDCIRDRGIALAVQNACACDCRHLPVFLQRMEDSDHGVRKEAVQLLNAAALTRPALTAPCIASTLPLLLQLTVVDESLVRIVELGPFKQKVDDGLSLRKHTLECVEVRSPPSPLAVRTPGRAPADPCCLSTKPSDVETAAGTRCARAVLPQRACLPCCGRFPIM